VTQITIICPEAMVAAAGLVRVVEGGE